MLADGTELYLVSSVTVMLAQMLTMLLDANCAQNVKLNISSSPCWLVALGCLGSTVILWLLPPLMHRFWLQMTSQEEDGSTSPHCGL